MNMLRTSVISIALLMASGCCATTEIIQEDYVAADRATFTAITPKYLKYIEEDKSLDDEEKARRRRTVRTWEMRLEQAETPVQPGEEK